MSGKIWRRLWHLGGGSTFPVLAFYLPRRELLIALCAPTALCLAVEVVRLLVPGVNRWLLRQLSGMLKEKERSRPTGASFLLLASVIVFLVFNREIAIASLLFLALGDPVAATVGERLGGRKVFGKNPKGGLASLLACIALGLLLVKTTAITIGQPVVIAGAASAAITEFLPLPLDDNLTVPLVSASIMTLMG